MAIAALGSKDGKFGDNGGRRGDVYNRFVNVLENNSNYMTLANNMGISRLPPNPLWVLAPSVLGSDYPYSYFNIPIQYQVSSGSGNFGCCTPGSCSINSDSVLTSNKNAGSSSISCNPSDNDYCSTSLNVTATIGSNSSDNSNGTNDPSKGVANLNLNDPNNPDNWENYLNPPPNSGVSVTEINNRKILARFILADICNMPDMHVYIHDNEPVRISDNNGNNIYGLASDLLSTGKIYQYIPDNLPNDIASGITGGGKLQGKVGVVNDRQYKFENFMKKIGGYILLGIIILVLIFLGYSHYKNTKNNN
jgi:hypothetical protein